MQIQEKQELDIVLLQPQISRLEASNAQALKNRLIDSISRGHRKIGLDFSHVDFMDSSGLAVLLSTRKSLGQSGKMALFGISDKVRKLLAITRLDKGVFTIADTETEAVQALQGISNSHE